MKSLNKKSSFIFFISILLLSFSNLTFANLALITWKGTYYGAVPNKKGISRAYCRQHTPGSFIHVVRKPIKRTFITSNGIKLDRGTFHVQKQHGFYVIHGDFWANGKTNRKPWHDHIYYHFTKLSEAGVTQGVWSSNECKGFYRGDVVKNKNRA